MHIKIKEERMRISICKVIIALMIIQFMSGSLISYPINTGDTFEIQDRDPDSFSWLIKKTTSSPSYTLDSFQYDPTATKDYTLTSYTSTKDFAVEAASSKFTCAILYDSTSGAETMSVVQFANTKAPEVADLVEDLMLPTGFNLSKTDIPTSTYEVADLCDAIKINSTVYHFATATGTKYKTADTLPTWKNPVFSDDFAYVAADAGLYSYTATNTSYNSILANPFYTNKQIWTTSEAIVVLSWVSNGTANYFNYSVQAFSIKVSASTTTYTLVGKIQATYYDANTNPPTISVSETLKTIVVYANLNSTAFFAKGKTFDYSSNTATEFTIPDWITTTQSVVSVSDSYLYARNIVVLSGTSDKYHGAYFIANTLLTTYFDRKIVSDADGITNWYRTMVMETKSGELDLIREEVTSSSNVITSISLTSSPQNIDSNVQTFSWDKTDDSAATITGTGTALYEKEGEAIWFEQAVVSKASKFYSVKVDSSLNSQSLKKSTYSDSKNYSLKAISSNYLCALIYESTGPSLQVLDFSTTSASPTTVQAAFYTGVDITKTTNTFDVSDDCKSLRINYVIGHLSSGSFVVDKYPTGTTNLTNPVFSDDFSIAVTDTGIYSYTAATTSPAADGIYNLDRADTFDTDKQIFMDYPNYIIFTYKSTSTHYSWRAQLNTIQNKSSVKVDQFTGTVETNIPKILVSRGLSKIIIYGTSPTDATKSVFVGKHIDWTKKIVKDITLPINTTGLNTQIALSDDYLYVNYPQTDKTHAAYMLMGSSCIQIFKEPYPYPTIDYERSFIFDDQNGKRQLILGHQYQNDNFVRILVDKRKAFSAYININPATTNQLDFKYTAVSSSEKPSIGKWLDVDSTPNLNYYEYNATATNKLNKISKTSLPTGAALTAYSENFDCAIVKGTSATDAILINSTDSSAKSIGAWATLVGTSNSTYKALADAGKVFTGSNCWAIRVDSVVFFKKPDGSAYTKSAKTFTAPVFDSSLNFVYDDGKVYKYNGTDYNSILTLTGLKATVQLTASSDLSRLAILSYEQDTTTTTLTNDYTAVVQIYINSSESWTNSSLPSNIASFSTYDGNPNLFANSELDVIAIWYTALSGTSDQVPACYVISIDTTTNTLNTFSMLTKFNVASSTLRVSVLENVAYFYHKVGTVVDQYIYNVDTISGLLVLMDSHSAPYDSNIDDSSLYQESGKLSVMYQYISPTDVTLKKRIIGNPAQFALQKGINSKNIAFVIQNDIIYTCPPGCSYCIDPNLCETCLSGFTLDSANGNICIKCGPTCGECDLTNLQTCTSCPDGFFLKNSLCVRCSSNCLTCNIDSSTCSSCKAGFYLQSNSCYSCIDNCISCSANNTATDPLCETCIQGYVYNSATQTCVKCTSGCTICNPEKIYECVKCGEGFEAKRVNNAITCTKCPDNCRICNNGICELCRDTFRLLDNTCVAQCILPCQQCSTTNASQCTSCIGGFTLNAGSCTPNLTCNTDGNCSFCPFGYNLVSGKCYQCQGGSKCRSCDNLNIESCVSCDKGYYLNSSGICQTCQVSGCLDCKDKELCQQCKAGYYLETSPWGKCVACDSRCKTCYGNGANCDTCVDGFTKQGWGCMNSNNVNISLKIGATFSSFTTQNYLLIEQTICQAVGKDPKYFDIHEIKQGSTIITGTMDADNSVQQNAIINSLQTLLATGLSIGGFPIQSTSITANTGGNIQNQNQTQNQTNPQQQQQTVYVSDNGDATYYRNVAIIVGVVIPIGLIIIFLVALVLYKKGIICQSNNSKVITQEMDSGLNLQKH